MLPTKRNVWCGGGGAEHALSGNIAVQSDSGARPRSETARVARTVPRPVLTRCSEWLWVMFPSSPRDHIKTGVRNFFFTQFARSFAEPVRHPNTETRTRIVRGRRETHGTHRTQDYFGGWIIQTPCELSCFKFYPITTEWPDLLKTLVSRRSKFGRRIIVRVKTNNEKYLYIPILNRRKAETEKKNVSKTYIFIFSHRR